MRKFKMLSTIAALALCVAAMVFGVLAANQVTFSVSSTISYTVQDVFVELETRVYSTNKLFNGESDLSSGATAIKSALSGNNFNALDSYNIDSTYALTPVNLGQSGATNPYAHTFRSKTPNDTPSDLGLNLEYSVENGGVYAYFVVVKVTNISSIPLYSFVRTAQLYPNDENVYTPPTVNNLSYMQQSYITVSQKDAFDYIVFGIALEDIRESVPSTEFKFPIEVTKDTNNLPNPPTRLTFGDVKTFQKTTEQMVANQPMTVTPEVLDATAAGMGINYGCLLNFEFTGLAGEYIDINVSCPNGFIPAYLMLGNYFDIESALQSGQTNSSYIIEEYPIAQPVASLDIEKRQDFLVGVNVELCLIFAPTDQANGTPVAYTITSAYNTINYVVTVEQLPTKDLIVEEGQPAEMVIPTQGYIQSLSFSNIDTSKNYIKLTSSVQTGPNLDEATTLMVLMEKELFINMGGSGGEALALVVFLFAGSDDGHEFATKGVGNYTACGYMDENGYYSWLIPTTAAVDGSLDLLLGIMANFNFTLEFEYVDTIEQLYEYELYNQGTENEYYSWAGYIWNGLIEEIINIPSQHKGKPVKKIESLDFNYNTVIIPESVEELYQVCDTAAIFPMNIKHLIVNCSSSLFTENFFKDSGEEDYIIEEITFNKFSGTLPNDFLFFSAMYSQQIQKINVPVPDGVNADEYIAGLQAAYDAQYNAIEETLRPTHATIAAI